MKSTHILHGLTIVAGILVMPAAMAAHDFWIEPSTFHPSSGTLVRVALRVGHLFDGDAVPRDPTRFERFVVATPDGGVQPVLGQDAADPAGLLRPSSPDGTHVIGYRSLPTPHWLEGHAFERYLAEEGLESISEWRKLRGQAMAPGREIFSRSAKALITVGEATAADHDRRLNLPLELMLEGSPLELDPGGQVTVRLLYLGAPLRGALVSAFNQHAPDTAISARSDASGRVTFSAAQGGMWLIKAVHMVPAPPGVDADWESFWASLTFEIR